MEISRYALSYRLLAFLAITCCFAGVARASGDALLFAVSVAGLTTGHLYMWRSHYAASRIRTGVLHLLLTILLIFLGRDMLFSWTNDPLLLARYLVYGLIVTSFDLRTRRNVMGTLVLAGMIFMLLGQMAFDLWYPVLVGVFVLLALAAGTAAHIGEETRRAGVVIGGTWLTAGKVWASFLFGFIILAAAVFLLTPRIGFGALTQASWLPSRIDLTARGPRQLPSRPSADVSSEFLLTRPLDGSTSNPYVPLGYAGSAADAPVMHVRSRVLTYWRGSTLDEYDGTGWLPSVAQMRLVDVGRNEYMFSDSDRSPPSRNWYAQTYYLLVDQPNALFTGYNPGRIYLPQSSLVALRRGAVYRSISKIPRLNPQLLRRDIADPEDLENLRLPPITERTTDLADSVVEGATTDYDKAARLEEFLLVNYRYDLGVEPLTPGRDAVDVFLFQKQGGYCSQFATTMAVMARHVGLPARVGVGYLPGLYNPMTGAYTARAGDAHAWVDIHFRDNGWVVFDPTPRPDLSLGQGINQGWISFGLLDFVGVNFTGAISSIAGRSFLRPPSIPGWTWAAILGGAAIASILAALFVARRRSTARQNTERYTALQGEARRQVLAAYQKMVALLARKGLPARKPAQTPEEYARVVAPRLVEGVDIVRWLTEATNTAAYDPRPLGSSVAQEARGKLATLSRKLALRTS